MLATTHINKDPIRIYMAGKMVLRQDSGGDNKIPGKSYRPFNIMNLDLPEADHPKSPVEPRELFGVPILYTGPWQAIGSYHGLTHGITSVGDIDSRKIISRAMHGIRQCEVFFAMLDGRDCYGTLVEIGYARGMGKTIIVGVTPSTEAAMYEDYHDMGSDLWFGIDGADIKLHGGNHASILSQLAALLNVAHRHLSDRVVDGIHRVALLRGGKP